MGFNPPSWASNPTREATLWRSDTDSVPLNTPYAVLGREGDVQVKQGEGSEPPSAHPAATLKEARPPRPSPARPQVADPSVSRRHAALVHHRDGKLYLIDLASREGTTLDGEPVPPNKPVLVAPGGSRVLQLGTAPPLRVSVEGGSMSGAGSAPARVRASHLLVKHAGSRRPSSWKEPTVVRSEAEALAMIQGFEADLRSEPARLAERFAALAAVESHCSRCGAAWCGGARRAGWFLKLYPRAVAASPYARVQICCPPRASLYPQRAAGRGPGSLWAGPDAKGV